MSADHFGRPLKPSKICPHGVSGCSVSCCPEGSRLCSLTRYHDGPCNGFPRSVDSSKGVYCYTPRPIADEHVCTPNHYGVCRICAQRCAEQSLGQYIDKRLKEGDRHQADAERLAADNRELKEEVVCLQRGFLAKMMVQRDTRIRELEAQIEEYRELHSDALKAIDRLQATLRAERSS